MIAENDIPKKSYFKGEEVCQIAGVKPYVLRFWEAEFVEISPVLSGSGKKLYDDKDLEIIGLIKKLLFSEKLTIEKAKGRLKEELQQLRSMQRRQVKAPCQEVKNINDDVIENLKSKLAYIIKNTIST
ncbi:MerR family transcriptional regulator [Bacteriovoracaceae bacterium]|nr:MerR family transcriptional regulator [Bacteriovoracaceae bacterium]